MLKKTILCLLISTTGLAQEIDAIKTSNNIDDLKDTEFFINNQKTKNTYQLIPELNDPNSYSTLTVNEVIKDINENNQPSNSFNVSNGSKNNIKEKKTKRFDFIEFGPKLSIVSFPRPLEFGLELKLFKTISLSVEKGILPKINFDLPKYETKNFLEIDSLGVKAKIFPFRGNFFVGAGIGDQTIKLGALKSFPFTFNVSLSNVNYSKTITVPVEVVASSTVSYFNPHLGWQWTWNSGFFMNLDFGWQFVKKTSYSLNVNANGILLDEIEQLIKNDPEYKENESKIINQMDQFTKLGLPSVSLLQIGWFF